MLVVLLLVVVGVVLRLRVEEAVLLLRELLLALLRLVLLFAMGVSEGYTGKYQNEFLPHVVYLKVGIVFDLDVC